MVHDGLENKIVEQHESSDQSTTNLQNNLHTRPIHHNNDQVEQHKSSDRHDVPGHASYLYRVSDIYKYVAVHISYRQYDIRKLWL